MDSRTGDLYPSKQAAVDAGVPEDDVIELLGSLDAVERVAKATKAARDAEHERARRKAQRTSRKKNR